MKYIEDRLIDNLILGDENAWSELIDTTGQRLVHTAYLLLHDQHLAEDVVQETFCQAFQKIVSFRREASLTTWLTRIAVNNCRNKLRSLVNKPVLLTEHLQEVTAATGNTEDEALSGLSNSWLRLEVSKLPQIYKEVIVFYYFYELSIKEISEILSISEGTLKSRLARARASLKKILLIKEES
ncbi:MAG: sigma-70 family RNA polymerase sigma factor [Bacillota bacterium]|nr:sigma-70 family RNA polymerase sigma factor [Bacillota bacterium]